MLHLYRRHLKSCPHRKWTYRRCQCPIYVKGTLGDAAIKKSLDTNVWEAAQKIIGEWALNGEIGQIADDVPTVASAAEKYLDDARDRQLAPETQKKYRTLLRGRLVPWCRQEGYEWLSALTLDRLTAFRATWPDAPLAKAKNQERLRAFLAWCEARGWIEGNPAAKLSTIKVEQCPTLPFSADEMDRILAAVDRYPERNAFGYDQRARLRAFVLVLRWSGLRISDVADLTWDRLDGRRLRLYTQKTGTLVSVPLPDVAITALHVIQTGGLYVFRTGKGKVRSAVSSWERTLAKLFTLAQVDGGHAHRFRDTFAVELLLKGVDLVDVSILLGHASVKVTEKHYSAWVATRQRRMEEAVAKTWVNETRSAPSPSGHPSSSASETAQSAPDPARPVDPPADAPAPLPTAECASLDQTSSPLARTGTDAECTTPTRPTLRLVHGAQSVAR